MSDSTPAVALHNVSKLFGDVKAVKETSLAIARNEFFSILGPSGCGKTTLMRLIAGFESLTSGSIELSGVDVTNTPTRKRDLNMLFQSYALFPHLSVYENVAFELRVRKLKKNEIEEKVQEVLQLVQLEGYEKRLPEQLSGGQKQRVALARAVIGKPSVVLLDEPLGALDKQLRKDMQFELKRLQREVGCTFIYVTHDQEEALSMSDRIAVMKDGEIHQIGSPQEIYAHPQTKFVATFIGDCNMLRGTLDTHTSRLQVPSFGDIPVGTTYTEPGQYILALRPEAIHLHNRQPDGWCISGVISEANYLGDEWKLKIRFEGGQELLVSAGAAHATSEIMSIGNQTWVTWNTNNALLIREEVI